MTFSDPAGLDQQFQLCPRPRFHRPRERLGCHPSPQSSLVRPPEIGSFKTRPASSTPTRSLISPTPGASSSLSFLDSSPQRARQLPQVLGTSEQAFPSPPPFALSQQHRPQPSSLSSAGRARALSNRKGSQTSLFSFSRRPHSLFNTSISLSLSPTRLTQNNERRKDSSPPPPLRFPLPAPDLDRQSV